jgi:hypothetical protein
MSACCMHDVPTMAVGGAQASGGGADTATLAGG